MDESKDTLPGGIIPGAALTIPLRFGEKAAWQPTAGVPRKIKQAKANVPIPIDFSANSLKRKPVVDAGFAVHIPLKGNLVESSVVRFSIFHEKAFRHEVKRRKEAEKQLCESQRSLRLVIDSSFNGVWDLDLRSGEINYGINWYRNLGYAKNDIPPGAHAWQALIHPDDLRTVLVMHDDLAQGLASQCEIEYRIKNPAGEWRWLLSRGRILSRDDNGKVLLVVGVDTDITRLKQIESAVQAARAELARQVMEKTAKLYVMRYALKVLLRTQQTANTAFQASDLAPGQVKQADFIKNCLKIWKVTKTRSRCGGIPSPARPP